MLLSFIIPVYNGEKYLGECLDSLFNQDIPESDFEVICVDDGSSDGSGDVIRRYQDQHKNVVLVEQGRRENFPRNVGLFQAKGTYIWLIDQDDIILDHCLSTIKSKLLESDCDRLVFRYYEFVGELTEQEKRAIAARTIKHNNPAGNENNVVWSCVFKRSFLIENEVWPHSKRLGKRDGGYGSDSFFIAEARKAGVKEQRLEDVPYYFYRKHSNQSVYNYSDKQCEIRIRCYMDYPIVFKEEYEKAILEKGEADFPETRDLVVQVRSCALKLCDLPGKWARIGLQKMRDEGLFPMKLPKVYTENYSWRDCVKANNGKGPLLSIAFYYSVNPVGLFFYNLLNVRSYPEKLKTRSKLFRKVIIKRLEMKNRLRNR